MPSPPLAFERTGLRLKPTSVLEVIPLLGEAKARTLHSVAFSAN